MKDIVLFDMDGTLTEPRQKVGRDIISILRKLSEHCEVGIVTGSDYDYLFEQCREIWYEIGSVPPSRISLMPCNGTKLYQYAVKNRKWQLKHSRDMREEIGQDAYNSLLTSLLAHQIVISCQNNLPLTGTFFHYRESMLNWCPVGRLANQQEREAWIKADTEQSIRERYLEEIFKEIKHAGVSVTAALGGSTSIDIYPTGWDKTYALNHFKDYRCWFVGDKCMPGGNDNTIYETLGGHGRAFATKSPENTCEIIEDIISRLPSEVS